MLFLFWPVLSALRTSLFDESLVGGSSWTGLSNYTELLHDPDFWAAMWHTAFFTILSVPPLVALPLVLALLVSRAAPDAVAVPARVLRAVRAAGLAVVVLDLELAVPARASASSTPT